MCMQRRLRPQPQAVEQVRAERLREREGEVRRERSHAADAVAGGDDEVVRGVVGDVAAVGGGRVLGRDEIDEARTVIDGAFNANLAPRGDAGLGERLREHLRGRALAGVAGHEDEEVVVVEDARAVVDGRLRAVGQREMPPAPLVTLEWDGDGAAAAERHEPEPRDRRAAEVVEPLAGELDRVVGARNRSAGAEGHGLAGGGEVGGERQPGCGDGEAEHQPASTAVRLGAARASRHAASTSGRSMLTTIAAARPRELLGAEARRGLARDAVDGLAQPPRLVAGGARAEHGDRPVAALLDRRPEVVAEAEALAHLLEEPRVGIRADDLEREREGEGGPRLARRGEQAHEVGLGEIAAGKPERPGRSVRANPRHGRRPGAARGERARDGAAKRVARDAAAHGEDHVRRYEAPGEKRAHRRRRDRPHARDRPADRVAERLADEAPPGLLVQVVGGILVTAADLVHHHALLLGEAVGRHGAVEELLGEQRERVLDVLVEDLEVDRDVLVARVGIVLAAELARAAVERGLVAPTRALEAHVLGQVRDPGMRPVVAGAGAHRDRDRAERAGHGIVQHQQVAEPQAVRLAERARHGSSSTCGRESRRAMLGRSPEKEARMARRVIAAVCLGAVLAAPAAAARTTAGHRRAAAWLSVAHPGLGEYYNAGWGFFFDHCPQKKFWLGFIPLYGWPGYLQILSAIDAYHGRTSDNLRPVD